MMNLSSSQDVLRSVLKTKEKLIPGPLPKDCVTSDRPAVIMGIDEAGRGPVLGTSLRNSAFLNVRHTYTRFTGPMVYGAAYWKLDDNDEICELGYDDSKALTKEKRDSFFKGIVDENKNRIGWILRILSAPEISGHSLAKNPVSLNQVSHAAAIEMIQHAIQCGINLRRVYIDTVGHPGYYEKLLGNAFVGSGIDFVVRKKADSLFPVVSAASICAKVMRDYFMENWTFSEPCVRDANRDMEEGYLGSGYPGDENTKKWLSKNMDSVFGFPDIVRFNWSTARDLIKEKSVEFEWEDPDQENQTSIMSFLQKPGTVKNGKRGRFYRNQGLREVSGAGENGFLS